MSHRNALGRHVVLVGFMGAGKTTLGRDAAGAWAAIPRPRPRDRGAGREDDRAALRGAWGGGFRELERHAARVALSAPEPLVVALGGGAVTSAETRELLADAFVVLIESTSSPPGSGCGGRRVPLARDEGAFRGLFEERQPIYREVADAVAHDSTEIVLAAGGVHFERGGLDRLGELVPGNGPVALVTDSKVMGIYGARAQEALAAG